MKSAIIILGISMLLAIAGCSDTGKPQGDAAQIACKCEGTCSGGKNCTACKNCKYCKHCSKNGGTCSVCKK